MEHGPPQQGNLTHQRMPPSIKKSFIFIISFEAHSSRLRDSCLTEQDAEIQRLLSAQVTHVCFFFFFLTVLSSQFIWTQLLCVILPCVQNARVLMKPQLFFIFNF